MNNALTIGKKLTGLALISVVLAAAIAAIGYRGMRTITDTAVGEMTGNGRISEYMARARANVLGLRRYEKDMFLNIEDPKKVEDYYQKWQNELEHLQEKIQLTDELLVERKDVDTLSKIKKDLDGYTSAFLVVLSRIRSGEIADPASANVAMTPHKDVIHNMESEVQNFSYEATDRMHAAEGRMKEVERSSVLFLVVFMVVAVLLSGTVSTMISRGISSAINRCVDFAEVIATGDLRTSVEITANDETRKLGNSLTTMAENLRTMIAEIRLSSSEVASSSDEISASVVQISKGAEDQATSADETSSTMVEMASQIDNVAGSAQALASNVDETSSAIQEMGSSVEQVARSADGLLASVDQTTATIEEMTASIMAVADKVKVVDQFSKDASKVAREGGEQLSGVIDGIGTSSKSIGKIVKIIEDIADQTNLLALNAAIEAARAGEAGKGFAVVAEEVNRLAERSMKSTNEISAFVEAVQNDTTKAVDISGSILSQIAEAVEKSSELVSDVYTATQEQSSGATQILSTANNMQEVTRQVAISAKQQATGAVDISSSVERMNNMTQQVADATLEQKKGGDQVVKAIEEIAAVSRQNSAATDQLSAATRRLAGEADRLQNLAARFTV